MTTIAFIGLGIMGSPMAKNLVQAGFDVIGFNRSPGSIDKLVGDGGRAASSVADAVAQADVVATMVPDSPDVAELLTGEAGVFASARSGTLIIDFSSIRPDVAADLASQGAAKGFRMLDAPVSGGEIGAVNGNLSIMVGGSQEDFDAASEVFAGVGKTIVLVGPAGAGQTVKAANQLVVGGTIQIVSEAMVFLQAYGVDMEAAVKVLAGGLAGNAIFDRKAAGMLARNFEPGFRIELHHKDMGIVTAAAREAGVAIPVGALVAQLIGSMKAKGHGALDHSALLLGVEALSGRSE